MKVVDAKTTKATAVKVESHKDGEHVDVVKVEDHHEDSKSSESHHENHQETVIKVDTAKTTKAPAVVIKVDNTTKAGATDIKVEENKGDSKAKQIEVVKSEDHHANTKADKAKESSSQIKIKLSSNGRDSSASSSTTSAPVIIKVEEKSDGHSSKGKKSTVVVTTSSESHSSSTTAPAVVVTTSAKTKDDKTVKVSTTETSSSGGTTAAPISIRLTTKDHEEKSHHDEKEAHSSSDLSIKVDGHSTGGEHSTTTVKPVTIKVDTEKGSKGLSGKLKIHLSTKSASTTTSTAKPTVSIEIGASTEKPSADKHSSSSGGIKIKLGAHGGDEAIKVTNRTVRVETKAGSGLLVAGGGIQVSTETGNGTFKASEEKKAHMGAGPLGGADLGFKAEVDTKKAATKSELKSGLDLGLLHLESSLGAKTEKGKTSPTGGFKVGLKDLSGKPIKGLTFGTQIGGGSRSSGVAEAASGSDESAANDSRSGIEEEEEPNV